MSQNPGTVHTEILADYDKLTVVEIRKLFKDRHIPATGLTRKLQLIERLRELDANTVQNVHEAQVAHPTQQDVDENVQEGPIASDLATSVLGSAADVTGSAALYGENAALQSGGSHKQEPSIQTEVAAIEEKPSMSAAAAVLVSPLLKLESTKVETQGEHLESTVLVEPAVPDQLSSPQPALPSKEDLLETATTSPQPVASAPRIDSPTTDESRKRKRRSVTPSISAEEAVQKKLKQDPESGIVHLKEDEAPQVEKQDEAQPKLDIVMGDRDEAQSDAAVGEFNKMASGKQQDEVQLRPDVIMEDEDMVKSNASAEELKDHEVPTPVHDPAKCTTEQSQDMKLDVTVIEPPLPMVSAQPSSPVTKVGSPQSTLKQQAGKDHRYKDLFSGSPASDPQLNLDTTFDTPYEDAEDRAVVPATHPATSALYIRDFMRPLQPGALKDHLTMLARPPSKQKDPDAEEIESTVLEFHLDAIRTHCFAIFSSVSGAARVRNALHERVWPAERTRKPLWVDFIPEDRVKQWIDMELSAGGPGRGASGKRWEVLYTNADDGTVVAELQEASAVPTGPRHSVGMGPNSAPMSEPLPTPEVRKEPTAIDGKPAGMPASFLALDQLFKSTTAKPKLYFLPVSRELADKRMVELDTWSSKRNAAPSGGSGFADSRRYTFEKGDHLVDNGPEFGLRRERGDFGSRGRGGYGPPRGSFRGRY